jgi:DNA-binding MarR family transcriptional regulator
MQNKNGKNITLKLAEFLPYRLSVLSNHISRAIEANYKASFGMTMPEWRVMAIIADEEGLSGGEVAQKAEMDKVAVSRAVSKLIEGGRINRQISLSDKRRSELYLSAEGRKVYEQIVPIAKNYEAEVLGQLSSDDQVKLGQILRKLSKIELG